MKVSGILVISVILYLHSRVVFSNIFSLNMKVLDIPVVSVIIKLQNRVIFKDIFSLSIRERYPFNQRGYQVSSLGSFNLKSRYMTVNACARNNDDNVLKRRHQ